MAIRVAVGDIMTRNLISIKPNTNLLNCTKELVKQRVNSLLITENKKLVGILTSRDILWVIMKNPKTNLAEMKAMDIATRKVAVIKPSADISKLSGK